MPLLPMPPLVTLGQFGGNWDPYCRALYTMFMRDVVDADLQFRGLPMSYMRMPEYNGMHSCFWHLITEDREKTFKDEDRTPCMRRCERVPWIRHVLDQAQIPDSGVKCWENSRGANRHVVLWVEQEKFVLILAKRSAYYLLKTIYLHNGFKAQKLEEEYRASLK